MGEVFLPETGTYYLLVAGLLEESVPRPYQIKLTDISEAPVATTGFGTEHSGVIAAGSSNSFAYTAPERLTVFFDALTNTTSLPVELVGPGGTVFTGDTRTDSGPYVLPRSDD